MGVVGVEVIGEQSVCKMTVDSSVTWNYDFRRKPQEQNQKDIDRLT